MADEVSIRVNFAKPIALFPLDSLAILPQQVIPLHIFEARYRQMVDRALDSAGQIAMAVYEGDGWRDNYDGNPPLKPFVCVGQIVQHERLPDGRYNILLQGVCRARIAEELVPEDDRATPAEPARLFREAMLEPVGLEAGDETHLQSLRDWVTQQLQHGPLNKLAMADQVLEYVENDAIPAEAVVELVSFALLTDEDTRYRLLSEPDADARIRVVREELGALARLIRDAGAQHPEDWPKGLSWN